MRLRVTTLRSPLMARLLTPKRRTVPTLEHPRGRLVPIRSLQPVVRVGYPVTDAIETLPPELLAELAWQTRASLGDAIPEKTP